MKIGILTFHCAHNFGAILQAYALQEQLRRLGHTPIILNYRPLYLDKGEPKLHYWMFTRGRALDTIKRYFKSTRKLIKSYKLYRQFENDFLTLTQPCKVPFQLAQQAYDCDYLILGSDQIWNPQFNGNEDVWFGNIEHFKGNKATYAASSGSDKLNIEQEKIFKKQLTHFKAFGIREEALAKSLKSIVDTDIPLSVVLDPTLMVNPQIWESMFNYKPKGKYILVYQARKCDELFNIAQKAANYYQAEIISVDFWDNSFRKGIKQKVISPNEFVSYVRHAECVITTSFHGTAFSLICNTPFYSVRLNAPSDDRIMSLLSQVELLDRFIDKDCLPSFDQIDFNRANKILEEKRTNSITFLENIFKQ